jgi:hypothetical protein
MRYIPTGGSTIYEAIKIALVLAKTKKKTVTLVFNGRNYTVKPKSTFNKIYYQFECMTGMYKSKFGVPFPKPK